VLQQLPVVHNIRRLHRNLRHLRIVFQQLLQSHPVDIANLTGLIQACRLLQRANLHAAPANVAVRQTHARGLLIFLQLNCELKQRPAIVKSNAVGLHHRYRMRSHPSAQRRNVGAETGHQQLLHLEMLPHIGARLAWQRQILVHGSLVMTHSGEQILRRSLAHRNHGPSRNSKIGSRRYLQNLARFHHHAVQLNHSRASYRQRSNALRQLG